MKSPYLALSSKKVERDEIIFNESNVNFDTPVYLVEGVFDMFPLYNAVPMLGKFPSLLLIKKLIEHKTRTIICLDEDALKDGIELYNRLISYNLDVYFVEIKGDIAKYHEDSGKKALIKVMQNFKKLDLDYIISLSLKNKKLSENNYNEDFLKQEWKKLKKNF